MDSFELLRAAGWYPGRQVDTSAAEHALLRAGYPLHDAAIAVLAEFSGLTITGPEFFIEGRNGRLCCRRQLWIDGERAAVELEDSVACEGYSETIGDTLVPVGYEHPITFLIGEKGAVWGVFDGWYRLAADSFVPAVARILVPSDEERPPPRRVPIDPAIMEMLRQRKLEEDRRNQQRGWRRFLGRGR